MACNPTRLTNARPSTEFRTSARNVVMAADGTCVERGGALLATPIGAIHSILAAFGPFQVWALQATPLQINSGPSSFPLENPSLHAVDVIVECAALEEAGALG